MSTLLKIIVVACAVIAGMVWIGVAAYFGHVGKPYVVAAMAAYPLLTLLAGWFVGFLGAIAVTCNLKYDDTGVTAGDAVFCAVPGSILTLGAAGLAVLIGPLIGAFTLGAKWFPAKPGPPKPANHWTNRVVFRCPGKPHRQAA